eukprot:CAMPEP_0113468838 /NCGR_PEP_ID=MMETSP0014_2-20120614/15573_1 /TAXON_ID=2857 /ORGANISM="Nitzschia sp." /LENGTH=360 /DNA_ID=CAMNT_0000361263 /DNA_START=740 /DNA_END=1822 /DNA_ORIENTATION=- /assembly_acc=CAM_ASM_000159
MDEVVYVSVDSSISTKGGKVEDLAGVAEVERRPLNDDALVVGQKRTKKKKTTSQTIPIQTNNKNTGNNGDGRHQHQHQHQHHQQPTKTRFVARDDENINEVLNRSSVIGSSSVESSSSPSSSSSSSSSSSDEYCNFNFDQSTWQMYRRIQEYRRTRTQQHQHHHQQQQQHQRKLEQYETQRCGVDIKSSDLSSTISQLSSDKNNNNNNTAGVVATVITHVGTTSTTVTTFSTSTSSVRPTEVEDAAAPATEVVTYRDFLNNQNNIAQQPPVVFPTFVHPYRSDHEDRTALSVPAMVDFYQHNNRSVVPPSLQPLSSTSNVVSDEIDGNHVVGAAHHHRDAVAVVDDDDDDEHELIFEMEL